MSNEKLSKLDIFTIGTLAALQFMQSVRQEAQEAKKEEAAKEKTPAYKPKNIRQPIMKVGKMYELNNGEVIFCHYGVGGVFPMFVCVPVGKRGTLEYDERGVCLECGLAKRSPFNHKQFELYDVRRTWKKKYARK